jgi:hypothetical protein
MAAGHPLTPSELQHSAIVCRDPLAGSSIVQQHEHHFDAACRACEGVAIRRAFGHLTMRVSHLGFCHVNILPHTEGPATQVG